MEQIIKIELTGTGTYEELKSEIIKALVKISECTPEEISKGFDMIGQNTDIKISV